MGNKKSTPKQPPQEGTNQTKAHPASPVKLREGKAGKKKAERPFSDSAATTIGDDLAGPNFEQFYLKPTDDISGKRITVSWLSVHSTHVPSSSEGLHFRPEML